MCFLFLVCSSEAGTIRAAGIVLGICMERNWSLVSPTFSSQCVVPAAITIRRTMNVSVTGTDRIFFVVFNLVVLCTGSVCICLHFGEGITIVQILINFKHKKSHYQLAMTLRPATSYSCGGIPQLPSALKSLTSVFGMGTGVTSSLSPPDYERYLFVQN